MAKSIELEPSVSWKTIPASDLSGLDALRSVDSLSINHGFSFRHVLTNFPMQPKYGIFNNRGEQLFSAFEECDMLQLVCCTNGREFIMHLVDNRGRELAKIHREFQSCSGCYCCGNCDGCIQKVAVESPPGQLIGTIQQIASSSGRRYTINDPNNHSILTIDGPCCICNGIYSCGCVNKYSLIGTDRITEIGAIYKKYPENMRISLANPVAFTINCE